MAPLNLTIEEQERWHYANGNTYTADILARAVEGDEHLQDDLVHVEEQLSDAKRHKEDAEYAEHAALERAEIAEQKLQEAKDFLADL